MTHRIKFTQLLLLGAAYVTVGVGLNSTDAHSRQPVRETAVEQDARPSEATVEQWRDRKFGMFIHFGLYSLAGGMWNGKKIDNGYSEQILANGHLPPEEYA